MFIRNNDHMTSLRLLMGHWADLWLDVMTHCSCCWLNNMMRHQSSAPTSQSQSASLQTGSTALLHKCHRICIMDIKQYNEVVYLSTECMYYKKATSWFTRWNIWRGQFLINCIKAGRSALQCAFCVNAFFNFNEDLVFEEKSVIRKLCYYRSITANEANVSRPQ